jgi:hypothetical protein
MFKETAVLFDNPKYSQLSKLGSQHTNIYKTTSTDSKSEASASQSDVPVPQVVRRKMSNKDDEYFHDSSVFIVNGLAQDETKHSKVQNANPPSEHYSSLLSETRNEESSYAQAIVSSKDKYVSEKGHLYQVLEEEAGGVGEAHKKADFTTLSVDSNDEVGFIVNPDACSTDDDDDDDSDDSVTLGSKSGVVYHTLLRTPTSENSPESSPGPGHAPYDVIDRSAKHSTPSSQNSLDPYNVIDRRVSDGNFSQPPSQYDLIDPQARRTSEGQTPTSQYDVIEPQVVRRVSIPPSQYDMIEPANQPQVKFSVTAEPQSSGQRSKNDVTSPKTEAIDGGYSLITRSSNPSIIPQALLGLDSSLPPPSLSASSLVSSRKDLHNGTHRGTGKEKKLQGRKGEGSNSAVISNHTT